MSKDYFKEFNPSDREIDDLIKYAIAPRPIALVSSMNADGEVNLSPFSYFNIFSHNPPVCVFSTVRRMRDGSTKHTFENIQEVDEVVINIVNYDMLHQQSLSSTEYPKGVDEFIKAGFTPLKSLLVKPPRVNESPVQLECKVIQQVDLGNGPGHGTLIVCEVLKMHFKASLLNEENKVLQKDLDLVARLGADWYCRVQEENLFLVPKPLRNLGIGIDLLPDFIKKSTILSGNDLAQLANVEKIPDIRELETVIIEQDTLNQLLNLQSKEPERMRFKHEIAKDYLSKNKLNEAWKILLMK